MAIEKQCGPRSNAAFCGDPDQTQQIAASDVGLHSL